MSRFVITVRQTSVREFTAVVEAPNRNAAFRLGGDPDNWLEVDDDAPLGDDKDEILDVSVREAEQEADDANPE